MSVDDGLRLIFRQQLPKFDWTSIESGLTDQGIPDSNFCYKGIEGWIEHKSTHAFAVRIAPEQVGWTERRLRHGGRTFVAVRRRHEGGPRLGKAVDQLWLYNGWAARYLLEDGLLTKGATPLGRWENNINQWNWGEVAKLLVSPIRP